MPLSTVSKEDDVGLQQKDSPKTIARRKVGAENGPSQSTGSLKEIDA